MTREQIIERSQSEKHDYPDVFTDKTGLDLQPIHSGVKVVPAWRDKREAVLTISTFRGDYNARHYYADIAIDGVLWEYVNEPESYMIVNEVSDPLAEEMYWLKLYRPVTEKEKKHDAARWAFYEVDDLTTRFDTMQEIFELAKLVFDTRFEGEWRFKVQTPFESSTGDFNEIYGRINKKVDMEQMTMHIGAVLLLVLIIVIIFSLLAYRLLNELDHQIVKNEQHDKNVDDGYYLAIGDVGWSDKLGHYVIAIEARIQPCGKCSYFYKGCPVAECQSSRRKDGKRVAFIKHEQDEKYKSTSVK